MKVSSMMDLDRGKANWSTQMVINTKASDKMDNCKDMERFHSQIKVHLKEISRMV